MRRFVWILLVLLLVPLLIGCAESSQVEPSATVENVPSSVAESPIPEPSVVADQAAPTPGPVWTETDQRWAGRSIYFLMTDRFSNGDPSNDNADGFMSDRSDPRRWHGGDFRGIINNLDYIQGMGFDAIWLTPVTRQRSVNAYHGYWQYDFYEIDPHFGTLEELKELVKAAHARDMLVMLDAVANHTGDFIPGTIAAPPFDNPDWYHNQGNIQNYGNQQEVEQGDLLGLDDINQSNPEARAELLKWIAWLRAETGADGFRIDTAKHMSKDFLAEFDEAAESHTMGEVFSGDVGYVADYSRYLDSVVDFPLYYGFKDALATSQPLQSVQRLLERDGEYRNVFTNGIFLDNHDVERFMCLATGGPEQDKQAQLHQALAVLFTIRGIPIVYYATEQQFAGCEDPNNREDMFESFDPSSPTYAWLTQLNQIREAHPALSLGTSQDLFIDANGWAFERTYEGDTVIVCVNNSWQPNTFEATDIRTIPADTSLQDALSATEVAVADGSLTCDLGPKQVAIFTPMP